MYDYCSNEKDIKYINKEKNMRRRLILIWMMLGIGLSKLIIQSPAELKKWVEDKHPDGIPYSVANYGDVPFGKSMSGKIVFSTIL